MTGVGNGIAARGVRQHPRRRRGTVVVSGLSSDAHTWNLVFLQLLIEESGYPVVNLGPCVPDDLLLGECRRLAPAMVVIGSVNGHGHRDGLRVIEKLRAAEDLAATPIVIGGKLGISEEDGARHVPALMAAGFDAVFADGAAAVADFRRFLRAAPVPAALARESAGTALVRRAKEWGGGTPSLPGGRAPFTRLGSDAGRQETRSASCG